MGLVKTIRKKLNVKQRIILLLSIIAVIALLIAGFTVRDRLGLSFFGRFVSYDNDDSTQAFSHGSRSENLFANLDYKLLTCSDTFLQLFSATGESLIKQPASFAAPAISSNGKQAVVYEVGGRNLFVVAKSKIAFTLPALSAEQYILSATINQSGWLAVTTKQAGYKGVVTVYNASYQPQLSINLSSDYPINAMVTPDCRGLYILSPGQSAGLFESRLLYYTLSEAQEPRAQISLGNNIALAMKSDSTRCWVLGENELFTLPSSGELSKKYSYKGKYLKRGSLDGNGFATLLLSNSSSGNAGTLLTVDAAGEVLGSTEIGEQVLALSAAGRYVAVLTPGSLRVFNKDLSEVHASEEMQGVQNIVLYPDGSVALISDETVRLYLP